MEGSWHFKDVANYASLSAYYDALLQDEESLKYWLDYILKIKAKDVLELASGSGVMAKCLKDLGYHVVASDISPQMKDVALKRFDGDYRLIDMTDFHLAERFDLILCLCDSINYLEQDELDKMFACVWEHLKSGGTFLFDMHDEKRLSEFKEEYIEEGSVLNTDYQWAIIADEDNRQLYERFTFYQDDGIVQEHHVQNIFDVELIKNKMMKQGFEVKIVKDFIPEEKILFMGVKK